MPLPLAVSIALAVAAPPDSPLPRAHHALVYDAAREIVLLTAGSTPLDGGKSFRFFNDVWGFDGAKWRPLAESGDRISGVGLAFDSRRGRVVSFGGYDGRSLDAVRTFDGTAWATLGRLPEMAAAEPGFAYDSARDKFVLFGGSAARGLARGETWELADGTTWSKVDVPGPPARQGHAMTFDAKRNRVVLFGGMGSAAPGERPPSLGDTWEYDGRAWTERIGPAPPARHAAGIAFDSKRGRILLFGGMGKDGFLGDTWSFDGAAWKKLAETGPEARAMGYMAYDVKRDRVVLFGGRKGWPDGDLGDTWEWDGATWRLFDAK